MKKKNIMALLLACAVWISCRHHGSQTITISETASELSMYADFDKKLDGQVADLLEQTGGEYAHLFKSNGNNEKLVLDDHTIFELRKSPGHVRIKLNRTENSGESYYRVRALCNGIKDILGQPRNSKYVQ